MNTATRILLVEDDRVIGDVLTDGLADNGYDTRWVHDAAGALTAAADSAFELVIVDLGLPDLDGVEVCRRIREAQPNAILVILTARNAEMDVVLGLEAGADDYLAKPVRLTELLARLRAHLRRSADHSGVQAVLEIGELRVDTSSRRATVAGAEIQLRTKEFDLLARMAREPDAALSRDVLMADVWDEHWHGPTKTLDVHIAAVRHQLTEHPGAHVPVITTLRGHGYRLELPATQRAGSA